MLLSSIKHLEIAVLYLARKAEGLDAFRAFVNTYTTHTPGIDHDLVIIFKGFEQTSDLEQAQAVFSSFSFISIEVPDTGLDIGSYFEAAKRLPHKYICCLNTFSKILCTDWLKKLYLQITTPHVGLVGATGSYEGLHDTIFLFSKAQWVASQARLAPDLRNCLMEYFGFTFPPKTLPGLFKRVLMQCMGRVIGKKDFNDFETNFLQEWTELQNHPNVAPFCAFPFFPNPHIRSNAFMMMRERFLNFKKPAFINKFDACSFESGHLSMTKQILDQGLKALIVGKNGISYDVQDWMHSNTFRFGNQENLLCADNHTQAFACVSNQSREVFQLITWGESSLSLSSHLPKLGVKFR